LLSAIAPVRLRDGWPLTHRNQNSRRVQAILQQVTKPLFPVGFFPGFHACGLIYDRPEDGGNIKEAAL